MKSRMILNCSSQHTKAHHNTPYLKCDNKWYIFFSVKNMGTAKAYLFRVLSHSATAVSVSGEKKYELPDDLKDRAVVAGLIGGLLFFIVAIVLSVCTVKICNKRRRRKHDRGKPINLFKKNLWNKQQHIK